MAIVYMVPVNITTYKAGRKDNIGYQYDTEDLAAPGNGDSLIMPDNVHLEGVTLEIAAGEGKIQKTNSSLANVLADTDVLWEDWEKGSVVVTTSDTYLGRPTALRMVNTSGTTRMLVQAN